MEKTDFYWDVEWGKFLARSCAMVHVACGKCKAPDRSVCPCAKKAWIDHQKEKEQDEAYWRARWQSHIRSFGCASTQAVCGKCKHPNSAWCPCARDRWIEMEKAKKKRARSEERSKPLPQLEVHVSTKKHYSLTMGGLVTEAKELSHKAALKIAAWDQNPNCNQQRFESASRQYFFHYSKLYHAQKIEEYADWLKMFREFVENDLP